MHNKFLKIKMFSVELIFQADMPTVRVTAKASYEK